MPTYNSQAYLIAPGGVDTFDVTFPYISKAHVQARVDGAPVLIRWLTDSKIQLPYAPPSGAKIQIYRETPDDNKMVVFQNGAVLSEQDLNLATVQNYYLAQEIIDRYERLINDGLAMYDPENIYSGDPDSIISSVIASILDSELLADLQARIDDIDLNAQSILEQTARVDELRLEFGEQEGNILSTISRLDTVQQDLANEILRVDGIFPRLDSIDSVIISEQTTRANEDAALASQIEGLGASYDGLDARLLSEETARADADAALATSIQTLQAFNSRIWIQSTAPTIGGEDGATAGDIWYDSDDGNHPYRLELNDQDELEWQSIRDGQFAVIQAQVQSEQQARIDADSALAQDITDLSAVVSTNQSTLIANINTEATARADEDSALSSRIDALLVRADNLDAAIITEQEARADEDEALASQLSSVQAIAEGKSKVTVSNTAPANPSVNDVWINSNDDNRTYIWDGSTWELRENQRIDAAFAAVTSEQQARISQDNALASDITTLLTRMGDAEAGILSEQEARIDEDAALANSISLVSSRVDDADAAILSEQTARANADSALADDLSILTTRVGDAESAIVSEQSTRASQDSALSTRIDGLVSDIGDNTALIMSEQTARANGDSALASDISTLQSSVDGHTSSIQTLQTVTNGLKAEYMVKTDVNGYVSGFGLYNTGATSDFIVLADNFAVVTPGDSPVVPFAVDGSGVYMPQAFIRDLNVEKINGGTVGSQWMLGSTGRIVMDTGTHMRVIGLGFGSDSNLVDWYGPKMSISNCSTSNSVYHMTTDGDAYFGGTLRAGTLSNSIQSTSVTTDAVAELGPFGSNGGPITINWSYYLKADYLNYSTKTCPTASNPTATLKLYRSTNGGSSWTLVQTKSVTGTFFCEEGNTYDPRYTRELMSGSWSYTDNLQTTTDRVYKMEISARSIYHSTSQITKQNLSITSIEE